jgi:hypothetical protein
MGSDLIAHTSRSDTPPEPAIGPLSAIYRRAIERYHEKQRATDPDGHDDHEMFRQGAKEANMT